MDDDFDQPEEDFGGEMSEVAQFSCALKITIKRAKFKRDIEFLGKQDPFVRLVYGEQTLRTKTIDDGGKEPVWDEMLELADIKKHLNDEMIIETLDEDMNDPRPLGRTKKNFTYKDLIDDFVPDFGEHEATLMLVDPKKGDQTGEIIIGIQAVEGKEERE